jgi:hypothetical protein
MSPAAHLLPSNLGMAVHLGTEMSGASAVSPLQLRSPEGLLRRGNGAPQGASLEGLEVGLQV